MPKSEMVIRIYTIWGLAAFVPAARAGEHLRDLPGGRAEA